MKSCNVGSGDRLARVLTGSGLLLGGILMGGAWSWVMAVVGLVPLITGLTGNCPAYSLLRINTCKK